MKKKKYNICILNYGSGNITSIYNAIKFLGYPCKVSNIKSDIKNSTHLILPGVGSYSNAMNKIQKNLPNEIIQNEVLNKKKPFLGICVGMQILSDFGYEFTKTKGLGWIAGEVKKINLKKYRLPHIGWNKIVLEKKIPIMKDLNENYFYFVHSYEFKPKYKKNIISYSQYEKKFVSIVSFENIYGIQFHPEKSQVNGLQFLYNFINYGEQFEKN